MSVQNPDRVVTKQDLKDFYDDILPYLGGGSSVSTLQDVELDNLSNGQTLVYDSTEEKWKNGSSGGGGGGDTSDCYKTGDTAETGIDDADYFPFYDSSASGKKKSLWSNIKSVLKTYFDTLYSTVKSRGTPASGGTALSLVNTGDMYTWNNKQDKITAGSNLSFNGNTLNASIPVLGSINRSDIYDTTEKVIGKWTDGRPVYQKTISYTMPTVSADGTRVIGNYASIGASIRDCISVRGFIKLSDAYFDFTNYAEKDNSFIRAMVSNNSASSNKNTLLVVSSAKGFSGTTAYFTIQYTKTSDSTNSFNYADENDYSTNEKIVGTWIDGSLLYQKTYTGTTNNSSSPKSIATLGSSVAVRCIEGYAYNSSYSIYVPINAYADSSTYIACYQQGTALNVATGASSFYNCTVLVTIKYTK